MGKSYILGGWVYTFVKMHQTVHLRFVHCNYTIKLHGLPTTQYNLPEGVYNLWRTQTTRSSSVAWATIKMWARYPISVEASLFSILSKTTGVVCSRVYRKSRQEVIIWVSQTQEDASESLKHLGLWGIHTASLLLGPLYRASVETTRGPGVGADGITCSLMGLPR